MEQIPNKHSPSARLSARLPERSYIDDLDSKLLLAYLRNCKRSFREIGTELGVSASTVMTRTSRLEKAALLKGYSAILDYEMLGYELTVVTTIVVSKGKLLEMEREIAKIQGVCAVYDVTGETDGIVIAKFHNREELSHFTKNLLALRFVERTNTHVVLTTVKEDFRLRP
jgi:DNA-binding Lrp family transcriptional regulator